MNDPNFQSQLVELLDSPRENLGVEIKDWLDLGEKAVAADLARELLALANHGGGYLLFGFAEREDGWHWSQPCPFSSKWYSQDAVNNLCKRYAEPTFHCSVHRVRSSAGNEHVVVEVPGGHRIPIRSKRAAEGSKLKANTYYVRRPGPESVPIGLPEDWDALLRRCVGAQRDELMDSFRAIVAALGDRSSEVVEMLADRPEPVLETWRRECRQRLDRLIAKELPDEVPSRYARGTFSMAYRLLDSSREPANVRDLMSVVEGVKGNETGWPVWIVLTRSDARPRPLGDLIEFWHLDPMGEGGAHSDFWRISRDGKAYLLRGYQEDESQRFEPGTVLELTLPVWRVAECLLHAARLAEQFAAARIEFSAEWTGLSGRKLTVLTESNRYLGEDFTCLQDQVSTYVESSATTVVDTLPELTRRLVEPLYTAFDFFQPPDALYAEEINRMRHRRD